MRRLAIQLTIVLLLVVGLCGPIFQNLDPWDSFPDSGDNFILILTAAAIWFGMTLCLALLIPLLFELARLTRAPRLAPVRLPACPLLACTACPVASPLPLRI